MEITNFLTKDFLSSFVGSLIAIELIIYFTKELPLIKKIPTKLYAIIISLLHLFIIELFNNNNELNVMNIYCLVINSFLIAIVLTGGYDFILGNIQFNILDKNKDVSNFIRTIDSNKEENSKITQIQSEDKFKIEVNSKQEAKSE